MAYGQTAITEDLYAARDAAGGQVIDKAGNVRLHELTSGRPYVTYEKEGSASGSTAITSPVATAYHGVSRPSIPSSADDLREELSIRLARHHVGDAAVPDLCYCYHLAASHLRPCAIRRSAATTSSATSTRN